LPTLDGADLTRVGLDPGTPNFNLSTEKHHCQKWQPHSSCGISLPPWPCRTQ